MSWLKTQLTSKKFWNTFLVVLFFVLSVYAGSLLLSTADLPGLLHRAGVLAPLLFILIKASTIIIAPWAELLFTFSRLRFLEGFGRLSSLSLQT